MNYKRCRIYKFLRELSIINVNFKNCKIKSGLSDGKNLLIRFNLSNEFFLNKIKCLNLNVRKSKTVKSFCNIFNT